MAAPIKQVVILAIAILAFAAVPARAADRIVSGRLTANESWSIATDAYVIDTAVNGPIEVPAGITLTVATGVTVKNLNDNKSAILVNGGTLNATGATFQFRTSASTAGGKQPIVVSGTSAATFTLCTFTTSDVATSANMESKLLTAIDSSTLTIAGSSFTSTAAQGQPTWYAVWTGNSATLNIAADGATATSFSGFPISVFSSSSAGVSIANTTIAAKNTGIQLTNAGASTIANSSFTPVAGATNVVGIENNSAAALTVNSSTFTGLATGVLVSQASGVTVSGGAYSGNTYGIVMNSPANLTVTNASFLDNGQGIRALRVGTLSLTGVTVDNTTLSSTSIGIYTDIMSTFLAASTTIQKQNIGLRLHHSSGAANTNGITFSQNNRDVLLDGEYTLATVTANLTLPIGRYILNNDSGPIGINAGVTLTLQAGTEILNKNQNLNLFQISGALNATGVTFILKTASNANGGAGSAMLDFTGAGTFTNCTFRSSDAVAITNSRILNLRNAATVTLTGCDLDSTNEFGFVTAKGALVSNDGTLSLISTTVAGFIHGVYSTSSRDLTVTDTDFMLNETGLYYSADSDLRLTNSTFTDNNWGIALPRVGVLIATGCTVSDNTYALLLNWETLKESFTGLTFANNAFDSFLDGAVTLAGIVTMPVMRYRMDLSAGPVVIPASVQLTIQPGTAITNNVAVNGGQRNDLFDVRGTLNATGATFAINTRYDASSGTSSRGTYGFNFAESGTGTFTNCVFSASDNGTEANSRIMNLADSAAVTIAGSTLSSTTSNGFKTRYGIVVNNNAALTLAGTAARGQSAFSNFPVAIQTGSLATSFTIANTTFPGSNHGILYAGTFTLAANYTLPPTLVSFENPLIVPAGFTLTIPAGATLRNYSERTALDVSGTVNAANAAFEFSTIYYNGTQAIILRGAATGTFTNCTFTASDSVTFPNGCRIFHLQNTASLSLSGCALSSTTARGFKTYYGIVVTENASLALSAAGVTQSTFTGFGRAIDMSNINVTASGVNFTGSDSGLTFPNGFTLSANWTLPATEITFNGTVTVPTGITLTIPSGCAIRNAVQFNQIFSVRGSLQATAASFVIHSYYGTFPFAFLGTGTGSFANCTFTQTDYYPTPTPTGSGVIYIGESAAVTVRDCVFLGRKSDPSYASTSYGIRVGEQGVLRFERGSDSSPGSSFDGFSWYTIFYSSEQPLSVDHLTFTDCATGIYVYNQSGRTATIKDSVFTRCGTGILANGVATLILENLTIDQSTGAGLDLTSVATLNPTNVNVTNGATALRLSSLSFDPNRFTLTNNTTDWIIQTGGATLTTNASLPINAIFNGVFTIPEGVTLTIPNGAVVRNSPTNYNNVFLVRGQLDATAGATFLINTYYSTDAIRFDGSGTGSFANCTFTATEYYPASPLPSKILYVRELAAVTVRDCVFQALRSSPNPNYANAGYGIYTEGQAVLRFETGPGGPGSSFDGFSYNGVYYSSDQPFSAANLEFTDCAIGLTVYTPGRRAVAVSDSSFLGCGKGMHASTISTLTLRNLAIDACTVDGLELVSLTTLDESNVQIADSATALRIWGVSFNPSGFVLANNNVDWNIQPNGATLTASASFPVNAVLNGPLTVAADATLTIPAGSVVSNSTSYNPMFVVRGRLDAAAGASFVINSNNTYAFQFNDAGTGSFTNCTFAATEGPTTSTGSRIMNLEQFADVTIRDCVFTAGRNTPNNPNYVNTGYGIVAVGASTLRFENGTGAQSGTSFTGFRYDAIYFASDRPLSIDRLTITDCGGTGLYLPIPNRKAVTIANSTISRCFTGIYSSGAGALTLQNVAIDQCTDIGMNLLNLSLETPVTTTNVNIANSATALRLYNMPFNPAGISLTNNTLDWDIQGAVTLTANASLPVNTIFNGAMTIAADVTLTIPAGRVVRNSAPNYSQIFVVRGHLDATAGASFAISNYSSTQALRFEGTGTGEFVHCTFTATEYYPATSLGGIVLYLIQSSAVTVRDCAFEARRSNVNYANSGYALFVTNSASLVFDEGADESTFTGFSQAAIRFDSGAFTPGPLRFTDNAAAIVFHGQVSMVGDVEMPEELVFGGTGARILVPEDSTLTIPAGLVVSSVLPYQDPFLVRGELIANDAIFNMIPVSYAFEFRGTGVGTFNHCRFNSSGYYYNSLLMKLFDGSHVSLNDCAVAASNSVFDFQGDSSGTLINSTVGISGAAAPGSQVAIYLRERANVTLDGGKIGNTNDNGIKIGYGLYAEFGTKLNVARSVISGFTWGIFFNGAAPFVLTDTVVAQCVTGVHMLRVPSEHTVRNNDFFANADYAVFNNTTTVLDGRDNFWGHSTGPQYRNNPGGLGDRISDYILFDPFVTDSDSDLPRIEIGNHGVGQASNAFGTPGNRPNALLARFALALDSETVRRLRFGLEGVVGITAAKLTNARLIRDVDGNGAYEPAGDGAPVAGIINFTTASIAFETVITGDGAFLVLADAVNLASQDSMALTLAAAGVVADPGIAVVGGMTPALHFVDRLLLSETRGAPENDNLGTAANQAKVELLSFFLTPGYAVTALTFRLANLTGIDAANFVRAELVLDANADGAADADETVVSSGGQVTTSGATGTIGFSFPSLTTGASFILRADFTGLAKDDRLTVGLASPDVGVPAGVAVSGAVKSVTHTVEIPLLILDTAFVHHNQFVLSERLDNVILLGFTFIPSGRRIDGMTFRLTEVAGIRAADVTGVRLIWDLNRNSVVDDGEIEIGGPGAVSINPDAGVGSITFSLPFLIQGEYLLLANVAHLEYDDTFTIGITGEDVRVGPRDVVEGGLSPVKHDAVRPERQESSLNQNWTLNYRSPGGISAYGAFNHSGDRVILGYSSGTAYVFDAYTNTPQVMFHKHFDRVQYAGFSADDTKAITVTRDGAVYVWNVATEELEKNLFSDILVRYAVASPDVSKLFIVTEGRGMLLDLSTGQRLWELVVGAQLNSADYSTDGSLIIVGCDDKRTYLVNAKTGVIIRSFQGHSLRVSGATFAANGTRMLSNSPDATATLWHITDNVNPITTVTLATQQGMGATVNSQGTRIAMVTQAGAYYLRLFNEDALEIWARQLSPTEFTGVLGSFEFDEAGGRILLTSHGNTSGGAALSVYFRVTDGAFLGHWGPRERLSTNFDHRVRMANDGDQIFYMNARGLDLMNRHTGKTISTLLTGDRSYDITPDGKKVFIQNTNGLNNNNVELYSLEDGRFTLVTSNTINPLYDPMTLSESGGLVIIGDRIFRTRTGEQFVNSPNNDAPYPSAFSPDESLWGIAFPEDRSIKTQRTTDVSGSLEYGVTLTNVVPTNPSSPYRPHKIFYHPDGIRVGCVDFSSPSSGYNTGVQMFRLDNNDPVGLYDNRIAGPRIIDAELSKDGTMLLIARGNSVKLFDVKTGRVMRYFYPQHSDQATDYVQAVGFGRDDRTVMIAWTHNYVELYDRAKLTRLEISPAARTLDVGESQRFVVRAIYDDGSQINVSPRYKRRNSANGDFNPGENAIEFAPGAVLLAEPPQAVTIVEDVLTVTAGASGEILLTAVYTEAGLTRSATAEITVGQAQLTALDATPDAVTLSKGVVIPISYIATFSDGYSEDVSDRVTMSADKPDRVRIVPPNVSVKLDAPPGDIQVTGQFTFRSTTRSATTTISNHGARSDWERAIVTPGGDGLGLEFSPDGTRMATGSGSGAITIYRVGLTPTQYAIVQTFIAHERPLRFLTYLSNTELLTAGEDGAIRKWNLADTSAPVQEYLHDAVITGVAYNNGNLAIGDNTGRVMLLNLATNSLRWMQTIHDKAVTTVALDADSVLSGGADEVAVLSHRSNGETMKGPNNNLLRYTGFSEPLVNVGYMGGLTYAAASDNRMQIWNKGTVDENLREYYYPATPTTVNYLRVGNENLLYVSTVFLTNATWVYNQDGLLLRWYEHPPAEGNIRSLRVTPDQQYLVTGRSTGIVMRVGARGTLIPVISAFHSYQFWNLVRGNYSGDLNHSFSLMDAKVNAAGTRLFTQCSKRTFSWEFLADNVDETYSWKFVDEESPDTKRIAADKFLETGYFVPFNFSGLELTADDPGHIATRVGESIFILDAEQRLLEKTVNTSTANFAISPNGARLMTNGNCSGSNCVRFWDIIADPTVKHENERSSETTVMAFVDNDDAVGTIPEDRFIARYNNQGLVFSGINFEQLAGAEVKDAKPEDIVVNGSRMVVVAIEKIPTDPPSYKVWVQVYDIADRLEAALVRTEYLGTFEGDKPKVTVALSADGNLLFWGIEKPSGGFGGAGATLDESSQPVSDDVTAGHLIDLSTGQLLNVFLPPSMGTIYNHGVAGAGFTRGDAALMIAWKEGYAAIYERHGLSSIQVSPVARTLPPESSVAVTTRAIFADGNIQDVTANATLSTATPNLAMIDGNTVTVNAGVPTGTQIVITSTYHELGATRTANVTLTVGEPTFLNMTVDPPRISVDTGAVVQYRFTGEFQGTGLQDITGFTSIMAVPADRVTITGNTVQVKSNAQFGEVLITGASVRNGEERSATAVLQIRNPFDFSDAGDFDGDRDVDFNDLVFFVGHYGETSASLSWDSRMDLYPQPPNGNPDGVVDFNDLTAFIGLYGTHYTARSASAAREESGVPFQGASEEREESAAGEEETDGRTLKEYATSAAREAEPLVRVTLEGPTTPVRIGEVFDVRVKVRELSPDANGFRGGPVDILFDVGAIDYAGAFERNEIIQAPFNTIITNGHLHSGLIDELGGVTVTDGLGENEPVLYAILKFTATRTGVTEISVAPGLTGLALTPPVGQVAIANISYGSPLAIQVAGENHAPIAHNLNFWAPANRASVLELFGSDPDGDEIALVLPAPGTTGYPAHGVATALCCRADETFSIEYTPETGYAGSDTFQYWVTDGSASSAPAVVHVSVGIFEHAIQVERGGHPFITLVYGLKPGATTAFSRDEGDHLAPPPGLQGEAYLSLNSGQKVSHDYRGLNDPSAWKLALEGTGSSSVQWRLSWTDQPLLPRGVQAILTPADAVWAPMGAGLDMAQHDALTTATGGAHDGTARYLLTLTASQSISYQFTADWNLIGVPFVADDGSQDVFFDDDYLWSVWGWDPRDGYVMPEFLDAKIGYWVFAETAHSIDLTGAPVHERGAILYRGWNLVSPSEAVLSPDTLSAVSSCWGWTLEGGYIRVSADDPVSNLCLPGVGYWIYATEDGVAIWE